MKDLETVRELLDELQFLQSDLIPKLEKLRSLDSEILGRAEGQADKVEKRLDLLSLKIEKKISEIKSKISNIDLQYDEIKLEGYIRDLKNAIASAPVVDQKKIISEIQAAGMGIAREGIRSLEQISAQRDEILEKMDAFSNRKINEIGTRSEKHFKELQTVTKDTVSKIESIKSDLLDMKNRLRNQGGAGMMNVVFVLLIAAASAVAGAFFAPIILKMLAK